MAFSNEASTYIFGNESGAHIALDAETGAIIVYDTTNSVAIEISSADKRMRVYNSSGQIVGTIDNNGFYAYNGLGAHAAINPGSASEPSKLELQPNDQSGYTFNPGQFESQSAVDGSVVTYLRGAGVGTTRPQIEIHDNEPGVLSTFEFQNADEVIIENALDVGTDALIGDRLFVDGVDQGRGYIAGTVDTASSAAVGAVETVVATINNVTFRQGRAFEVNIDGGILSSAAGSSARFRVRKTNAAGAIFYDFFNTRSESISVSTGYSRRGIIVNSSGADVTCDVVLTMILGIGAGTVTNTASVSGPRRFTIKDVGAIGVPEFASAPTVS